MDFDVKVDVENEEFEVRETIIISFVLKKDLHFDNIKEIFLAKYFHETINFGIIENENISEKKVSLDEKNRKILENIISSDKPLKINSSLKSFLGEKTFFDLKNAVEKNFDVEKFYFLNFIFEKKQLKSNYLKNLSHENTDYFIRYVHYLLYKVLLLHATYYFNEGYLNKNFLDDLKNFITNNVLCNLYVVYDDESKSLIAELRKKEY